MIGLPALALLLLAGAASAAPGDGLPPIVARLHSDGEQALAAGDWAAAERLLRAVLDQEPDYAPAIVSLGAAQAARGDVGGARRTWARAPYSADAVEALARSLLDEGESEAALQQFRRLQLLDPGAAGPHRYEAEAMAHLDPVEAARLFLAYLDYVGATLDDAAAGTAAVVATALASRDAEGAVAFVEQVEGAWEQPVPQAFLDVADGVRVKAEARALAAAADRPLSAADRVLLDTVRSDLGRGDVALALDRARAVARRHPDAAEAWSAVAEAALAADAPDAAEDALLRAEALAPLDPAHPAALGALLAGRFGGRFDADAHAAYRRAVRLDPTVASWWRAKARLEERLGDVAAGRASWQRVAALGPAADAAQALADLERARVPLPDLPDASGPPSGVPAEAWLDYHVAYVLYARRGDLVGALSQLEAVRERAPDFVRAVNLEAAIRLEQGDAAAALARYRASLELDDAQPLVHLAVGRLLQRQGDLPAAEVAWQRAAALGGADAHYLLAAAAFRRWRVDAARAHLRAFATGDHSALYAADAAALSREVSVAIGLAGGGVAAAALVGIAVPVVRRARRRRGRTLAHVLEASPRIGADVARLLSLVRHEVIKHDAVMLPAVADALEAGDDEAGAWAAGRLGGEDGAIARFRTYISEVEAVAEAAGARLATCDDPVLGPLVAAFDRLERLLPALRRGDVAAVGEVRALAEVIDERGASAIAATVRGICVMRIDEGVLRGAWAAVNDEPGLRGGALPTFSVVLPGTAPWVRMYRADLHDVLVNLLRNALRASIEAGVHRLAVRVDVDEDYVTGLERVAIRVCDDAPRRIDTASLRGRYVERGLGMAVDLVSRAGGSMHVEDEPGFVKAVVVRLPTVEEV